MRLGGQATCFHAFWQGRLWDASDKLGAAVRRLAGKKVDWNIVPIPMEGYTFSGEKETAEERNQKF
jgi:hypothetical protein